MGEPEKKKEDIQKMGEPVKEEEDKKKTTTAQTKPESATTTASCCTALPISWFTM